MPAAEAERLPSPPLPASARGPVEADPLPQRPAALRGAQWLSIAEAQVAMHGCKNLGARQFVCLLCSAVWPHLQVHITGLQIRLLCLLAGSTSGGNLRSVLSDPATVTALLQGVYFFNTVLPSALFGCTHVARTQSCATATGEVCSSCTLMYAQFRIHAQSRCRRGRCRQQAARRRGAARPCAAVRPQRLRAAPCMPQHRWTPSAPPPQPRRC
jgi:hypothetical protein